MLPAWRGLDSGLAGRNFLASNYQGVGGSTLEIKGNMAVALEILGHGLCVVWAFTYLL